MKTQRILQVALHNVRSLWNIGAMFRSSDVFAIDHLYLTGYTAAPPRVEISRTAIGAESWIPWTKEPDILRLIQTKKEEGFTIVALEKTKKSLSLSDANLPKKVFLVLGHEILGVPEDVLGISDAVLHIPMLGKKTSLNVSSAFAIAAYQLRNR